MRVKTLQLKDYKRFRNLTIDLGPQPKRIVALVGPNGSGKSSIFDGLLYGASAHATIGEQGRREWEYHSLDGDHTFDLRKVLIEFETGSLNAVFSAARTGGKAGTIISFRSPYRYNANLKVHESSSMPDIRLNHYGASTTADLDRKMDQSYRRLRIKYQKYLDIHDCRPSEAKAAIISELNSSLSACLNMTLSEIGDIESSRGSLYFTKPDQRTPFEFNLLSAGEKEVVDILLDLYLRMDDYNDTVFLLDEPDLHVSTAIQRKLLVEINRLIGENCQLWLSTHSIGFLRALQEELRNETAIIELSLLKDPAIEPAIITPSPPTHALWRRLFSVALDDLVSLVSPELIIYCEGKDKPKRDGSEAGFDATVYNVIFGSTRSDAVFVSSGGNTELDQRSEIAIAIIGKALPKTEILVLKDRDMISGRESTQEDRRLYLQNNPSNHRVLLRREIENYIFDKEIVKLYATASGATFNDDLYDHFVQDIENQDVKGLFEQVKRTCGLAISINADRFKMNLAALITPDTQVYKELEACIFH